MRLVADTDETVHTSPHTRTAVSVSEKPLPAIVRLAPPASVVTTGAKLVAASGAPTIIGAPRAAPHSEAMVTTWLPAIGGVDVHVSNEAPIPFTVGTHSVMPPSAICNPAAGKELPSPKLPVRSIDHSLELLLVTVAVVRTGVRARL